MLKGRQRMVMSVKSRKIAKNQKSGALLMHTGAVSKVEAGVQAVNIG